MWLKQLFSLLVFVAYQTMNSIKRKRNLFEVCKLEISKLHRAEEVDKENIPPAKSSEVNFLDETVTKFHDDEIYRERSTPKKRKSNIEEPVTPNTNFKLLTSLAATLDYAKCNAQKAKYFNSTSTLKSQQITELEISDDSSFKINRKEKSLGLICTRFLAMYPLYPPSGVKMVVSLDEACLKLGVERRRLYDIVNVFESIDILTRNAKNQYLWFGKNNLLKSLARLKAAAIRENMLDKLQYVLKAECTPGCKQSCILNEVQDFNKNFENQDLSLAPEIQTVPSPEMRREKSIGIMSQKFLMLFLVSPCKVISLGVAAKVLNGFSQRNERGAQVKTQIRRLYDIANVLSSIDLIQKEVTMAHQGRKPAFKYIGPDVEISSELFKKDTSDTTTNKKSRSLVRHSSFQDMCAVAEIERQKLHLNEMNNSAPPFESNLALEKSSDKITFSHLTLNNENPDRKRSIGDFTTNSKFQSAKKTHILLKPLKMKIQPNFKVMNAPAPASTTKVPCYIVNNISANKHEMKSFKQPVGSPSVLIINTSSASNQADEQEVKKSLAHMSPTQTIALSLEQRDAILKSLNISLSAGQIAVIQLEGSSHTSSSPCNLLKIINKTSNDSSISDSGSTKSQMPILQDIQITDISMNGPASLCSTRNNSPTCVSVLGSPLSIPSGYVTPVPSVTSEISFPSNTEVDDILEKIERRQNAIMFENKAEDVASKNCVIQNYSQDYSANKFNKPNHILYLRDKENNLEELESNKKESIRSLGKMPTLLIANDSCSSDSLNSEISDILKEKSVDETTFKPKSFLIDEKTILSPIKKPVISNPQISTPIQFFTSYFTPDSVLIFDSPLPPHQNTSGSNSVPFPVYVKTRTSISNNGKIGMPTS